MRVNLAAQVYCCIIDVQLQYTAALIYIITYSRMRVNLAAQVYCCIIDV